MTHNSELLTANLLESKMNENLFMNALHPELEGCFESVVDTAEIKAQFQKGNSMNVYCGGHLLYRRNDGKLGLDRLDNPEKWAHLINMYKNNPEVSSVLKHIVKRPEIVDPVRGLIDISLQVDYPMLVVLREKSNPKKKVLCFAQRTYFAKIDSRAQQLTSCFPLYLDDETGEVTMLLQPYYITKKPLPNNKYVKNHGGVWYTFKVSTEVEMEALITFFDLIRATNDPPTEYHALYPQK